MAVSMQLAKLPSWQDQLAIASFVVTTIGFVIAIWQIRRGVRASEASARAIKATANRLAANQLLLLVPQLELLDYELDIAVRASDREGAERALVRWRYLSSKVRGVLLGLGSDSAMIERLQRSASLATLAKGVLRDNSKPLQTSTKRVSFAISEVCNEITAFSAQLSTEPGDTLTYD